MHHAHHRRSRVHFPINLQNSHWTLATVDLSAAKAIYIGCLQNEPPSKLKAGLQALLAKKRAGSGGRAKKPASNSGGATVSVETDHAAMPKQDDTHSCGPLALCGMLLRAAGLPLSMKVRNTSEVCLRLRTIVAAIAARVPTAEEGGGGAAIESALGSGLWLPVPVPVPFFPPLLH